MSGQPNGGAWCPHANGCTQHNDDPERCSPDCEHDTQSECIAHLKRAARRDSHTQLDRNSIMRELVTARIQRGHSRDHFTYALLDLDSFKTVNDTYGHLVGDDVLREASDAIRKSIRLDRGDHASRRGGDEFAVMLSQALEPADAAERVRAAVVHAVARYGAGCSLGVAVWPDDGSSWEELERVADERMRRDKAGRKAGR